MKIVTNNINPKDFVKVRNTSTHVKYDVKQMKKALKNSSFSVIIYVDGEPTAIGRIVGDGILTFFFKDIIVSPEHQKKV